MRQHWGTFRTNIDHCHANQQQEPSPSQNPYSSLERQLFMTGNFQSAQELTVRGHPNQSLSKHIISDQEMLASLSIRHRNKENVARRILAEVEPPY
jgi:hypothetical protein